MPACHSTVDAAPKTMIDLYGPANGFGWKMDEIIGAQIVSVPMTVPIERANKTFTAFMGSLAAVFVAIFVLLNVMLYTMVIRRVTQPRGHRRRGEPRQVSTPASSRRTSRDEIGVLTEAMGRMKASLVQAMKMLEG